MSYQRRHVYSFSIGRDKNRAKDDCAVVSMAVALDITYDDALALLTKFGYADDGDGAPGHVICSAYQSLGGRSTFYGNPGITFNQFVKANPTGTHLVLVKDHVAAVRDGVLFDTWDSMGKSGRKRVDASIAL